MYITLFASKLIIISDFAGFCSFAGGGVRKQFEENNLTVTEDIMFIEETLTDSIMDFHLKKLSRDSRS